MDVFKDIKKDFPIFKAHPDLVYLDNAATTQVPQQLLDSLRFYHTECRTNVHRSSYQLSEQATQIYEQSRTDVASFINADSDEIIFTSGTTGALNMLAYMLEHTLDLDPNHRILTTVMEHHSSLLPFQEMAKRVGCIFEHSGLTEEQELDYADIERKITEETKIVVVILASNVLGTINDVKRVAKRAHEVGALVVVDAAKAAGHIPINVKDLDVDFLAFSAHKMTGPTGIGVLYGRHSELTNMYPGYYGGGMVSDVNLKRAVYADIPMRFEPGTLNIAGAMGLGASVRYLKNLDVASIHAQISALVAYALEQLGTLPDVTVYAERNTKKNAGVVSFTVRGVHPHDVAEILGRSEVAVRAGHMCAIPLMRELGVRGVVRASIYFYNTMEDIDRLIAAIKETRHVFTS